MGSSKRIQSNLTVKLLESLDLRETVRESLGYGAGTLEAQRSKKGLRFCFRYGKPQRRINLPAFNELGQPLSLAEARTEARRLSARALELKNNGQDLAKVIRSERPSMNESTDTADPDKSFGALIETYTEWMLSEKKQSANDVINTINNHIPQHKTQWVKPATEITLDDILIILDPLIKSGKLTTARKIRAYLMRAYSLGIHARTSAQASAFRVFCISHNPAAATAPIEGANRPRDIALNLNEFRAIWRWCATKDERIGPLLTAYILLGGQRFAQLRRAQLRDLSDDKLVLWDEKGRRTHPRKHVVPVLPEASNAINQMRGSAVGPYIFTFTNGQTAADESKVSKLLKDLSERMMNAKQISASFTLGSLRSTIETQLASKGLQSDTLAQLQSHGLGGVQWRHYNRHDYFREKLNALETLYRLVNDN